MTTNNTFSIQNVTVQRGDKPLLEAVNLTAKNGNLLRIIGKNGSGKTSLLRILAGLSQAEKGRITWNDTVIDSSESFQKSLCYLGHRDGNKINLSALENLRFYQTLLNAKNIHHENQKEKNEQQLLEILNKLSLLEHADTATAQLSFGQKRRLGFARLLIAKRALWLLDEPFTGVDITGKALLESLCLEHINTGGILIMTHHGELDDTQLKQQATVLDLVQFKAHTDLAYQ